MFIRNKTLYDRDLIVKYNNFFIKSYLRKNFVVMSLITFGFIIYMLIQKLYLYAAALLAILIIYLIITYFMQKAATNRLLKKSPLVEQPVLQTYEFRDEDYDVINIRKSTESYSNIRKLNKSRDFYILVTKDDKRHIVSFTGFDSMKEQFEFEDFIKEKISKKKSK